MIKFIFTEIKKIILPSVLVILFCVIYYFIYIINYFNTSRVWCSLQPWSSGGELIDFFFPLLVAAPYCWQVFFESKGNYFQSIHTRINLKKYLVNKCIITALLSGLAIIVINIIGFSFALYLSKIATYSAETDFFMNSNISGKLILESPLRYGIMLSLWRGFIAMLICIFGFIVCLMVKNFFVAITLPFVYYILEDFVMAILGTPATSLTTSITPSRLSAQVMSYSKILVGPFILCIVIILLLISLKFLHLEKYKK